MNTSPTLHESIVEIQQSRSRFQLESFVIRQHDTPEMQFYQICLELQDIEYKLALATLNLKKEELKVQKLRHTCDPIDAVKAEIRELGMEQTRLVMGGALREVAILREMYEKSPKFTREEIELAQPEYWKKRLQRQYDLQEIAGAAGWAQLDAMRQAEMVELSGGALYPTFSVAELGEPTRL